MVAAMGTSGITSFVPRALVAAGLSVIISFAIAYTAMPMMGARFDAVERSYLYRLLNRRSPPTLEAGRAWHLSRPLDAAAMHAAAQVLVGHHDFSTFRDAQCQAASPVKSLDAFEVTREGDLVSFRVRARSFLHRQVRSMVGSLSHVGEGRWSAGDLEAALKAADRRACGVVAPACGLYLVAVRYP